jgi:O-antigen ligase
LTVPPSLPRQLPPRWASRQRALPWLLLALVPLALLPLTLRPTWGIGVIGFALLLTSASVSIAYPLGLSGFAGPVTAVLGHDPFPARAVPLLVFAWIVAALLFPVMRTGWEGGAARFLREPAVLLSIALLALMLLRLPASNDPSYGDFKLELFVISNLALLAAGIVLGTKPERLELFLLLSLLIDAVSGLLVLRQFGSVGAATNRYGLEDQNVISLGIQGAQGVMVTTYLMLKASRLWRQLVAVGLLPVAIVALLASGSRGPVLGGAAGLLALLVLLARSRTSALRVLAVVGVFIVAWVGVGEVVPAAAAQRALSVLTGSGSGESSNGRDQLWVAAWDTMLRHPLLGAGTGSFAHEGRSEVCPGPGCLDRYPHNVVLETGAELGIVGALITIAFLVTAGGGILRLWSRSGDDVLRSRAAVVFALYLAAAITSLLTGDISGDGPLWLAAGLGIGLGHKALGAGASRRRCPRRSGARTLVDLLEQGARVGT